MVAVLLVTACSTSHPGAGRSTTTAAPPTFAATTAPLTTAPLTTAPLTTAPLTTAAPPTTIALSGVPVDMLNPAVTQATISATICVSGYTATVRPPTSFTDPLKVHQIASYGYVDTQVGDYEEDHVVALEIGGAPAATVNLFPEPHTVSHGDDTLENDLHSQVCHGQLSLSEAQLRLFTAKLTHGYSRAASAA